MIDPEDGSVSGQDTDDRVYNVDNDGTPSANFPNDEHEEEYEDNRAQVTEAGVASEPSFTLEPEKGLTPDPDSYNKGEDREDYNLKQFESDEDRND